jgi:4-hydroxybenzoate polyprenyltransferase
MIIKNLLRLIRIEQWLKNLLVFIPLFFAQKIHDVDVYLPLILTFMAFCFLSSAAYIFNDLFDIEYDKVHPFKKYRPLADDRINKNSAITALLFLMFFASISMYSIGVYYPFIIYILFNIFYTLKLKKVPYLEMGIICFFYIFRMEAGSMTIDINSSMWLLLMTFLGALILVSGKRILEMKNAHQYGFAGRSVLSHYSRIKFKLYVGIISFITFGAYLIYCLNPAVMNRLGSKNIWLSAVFILVGLIRFNYLIGPGLHKLDKIKEIWFDKVIIVLIIGWLVTLYNLIYL